MYGWARGGVEGYRRHRRYQPVRLPSTPPPSEPLPRHVRAPSETCPRHAAPPACQVRHPRPHLFTAVGVKRRCSHLTGTTSSTPPSPGLAASTALCASSCPTRWRHSRDIAERRPVHSGDVASRRRELAGQTPLQEWHRTGDRAPSDRRGRLNALLPHHPRD